MQRANRTAYAVLGFLTWGPMSGYDIKKTVEQSTANFWCESYGQIYPILRRLTEDRLAVRAARDAKNRGGRERQAYRITERGQEELRRWLREPTEPPKVRHELLLKLFFARQAAAGAAREQIESFRRHHAELLSHYAGIRSRLEEEHAGSEDLPFWLLTLRYGELERRAVLTWCDEALALLTSLDRTASRTKRRSSGGRSPRSRNVAASPPRTRRKQGGTR
jgi:PadR family transcriptional regulator, regulatory protein AphA